VQDECQAHPWLDTVLTASSCVQRCRLFHTVDRARRCWFWRGLFAGLFMSVCIVLLHRKETVASLRNIGLLGLLAAMLSAAAAVCYLNACASQLSPRSWRSMPRGYSSPAPHIRQSGRDPGRCAEHDGVGPLKGVRAARLWRRPVDCHLKRLLGSEEQSGHRHLRPNAVHSHDHWFPVDRAHKEVESVSAILPSGSPRH
jgi:hypothetical protein